MNVRQTGDGARKAQLFRRVRGLEDVRACDLRALTEEDGIEVCDFECQDPGCTALLVRESATNAGIFLAPGQSPGRRRFSIGHELGHFHIPRHAKTNYFGCTDSDMRVRSVDSAQLEWEANEFAAELLMPRRLFTADAAAREASFESVYRLAAEDMYAVSATAAAWRFVQVSRQRCALVVTGGGRVEWVARSSNFGLPLIERHQSLSPESGAAAAVRGEGARAKPDRVPWHAWFDGGTSERHLELLESCHAIPSLDQVLSLLWVLEGDDVDEEDDE